MGKLLGNKLAPLVLSALFVGGSGCASVYETEPIFRFTLGAMQELTPEFLQSSGWKEYKKRNQGPWAGTPVVSRIINPDGSIIFILDANKLGKPVSAGYADQFLDMTKYKSTWSSYGNSGFIVTYIPLE